MLFGEFCHDSTKKKALIFVIAAPKFANTISRNNRGGRAPWYVVCFCYNTSGMGHVFVTILQVPHDYLSEFIREG